MEQKLSYQRLQKQIQKLESDLSHLQEENAHLQSILDAFIEGSSYVLKHKGFTDTARSLFNLCKKQIGAQCGYVALLNEEGTENEALFLDSGGLPTDVNPDPAMPVRGLRGEIYATSEPVYENDFENSAWMKFLPNGHVGLKNVLFAPLVHEGKTVGMLGLANKPSGFDEKDAGIAAAFGKLAAIALRDAKHIDEAQKTESVLRQSETRFRSLFHTMNEGVCLHEVIHDANGNPIDYQIRDVNPAYERITGITREEARSKKATELYSTGEPPFLDIYARVADTGRPETFEIYWPPMKSHFLISVFSPRTGQFATVFTDITAQKESEEQLRVSEEYLSTTLNSIGDAVIATDRWGRVARMNPVAENLTGWRFSDAEGKPLEEVFIILNQKTREKVENPVSKVLREGSTVSLANDTVLISKNGKEYFIDDSGAPIKGADDGVVGVALIFRDITEKYIAAEELRKSEEKMRLLFEGAHDLITLTDSNAKTIWANSAWKKIFGSDWERHGGLIESIHPADQGKVLEAWRALVSNGGEIRNLEYRFKGPTGSYMTFETSAFTAGKNKEPQFYVIAHDISHRKYAEEKIKNQAETLNVIFDSAPNILVLVNEEGRVEKINHKGAVFSGRKREELFGLLGGEVFNCLNSFNGDGCSLNSVCSYCPVRSRVDSTLRTGRAHTDEEGQMTFLVDGKETTLDLLISTSLVELDGAHKVLLSLTDITKLKQAEKALGDSERKFRDIFDTISDSIYIHDLSGRVLEVNQVACEKMGRTRDELLRINLFDGSPENRGPQVRERIETVMKRGRLVFESAHRRKDGLEFPVEISSRKIEYEGQTCILNVARDIAERKQSQANLKNAADELFRRNRFIETILDNLPIGLAVNHINEGKAIYINRKFEEIYGWPAEELVDLDRFFEKAYPDPLYREKIKNQILADILSGDPERMAWDGVEVTGKEGGKRIVSAKNIPLYEQNIMISTVQDVTESRNLQARLQQAQKMEAIGTLAGGIAHDFNNILGAISGFAEMALFHITPGSSEGRYIDQVLRGCERAKDLVRQILAFSRRTVEEKGPVLIPLILKEALKFLRATLPTTITIESSIDKDSGAVMADPVQIHQIVMNLCSNAGYALRAKGGLLQVRLHDVDLDVEEAKGIDFDLPPGSYTCLTVSDTGVGIDPAALDKIFDPFFTTKEKGEGTGLGLSVVHGIVKGLGGAVSVESEPGLGSTFQVFLPRLAAAHEEKSEQSKELPTGSGLILFVDDEEALVNVGQSLLGRLGYEVIGSTSGRETIELFRSAPERFDLIITDLTMPEVTGVELAKAALAIRPDIPIILCTGYQDKLTESRAREAGIQEIVLKPIKLRELGIIIDGLLHGKRK